jgi:glycosyltransferase involved in cell wall biosynthesis
MDTVRPVPATTTDGPLHPGPVEPFAGFEADEAGAARTFLARYGTAGAPVAVVIAAYNEEATVASVVAGVPERAAGLVTETIVVVDGAGDATARRAVEAGALVCDVPVNRGQGATLRLGYRLARARDARIVVTIDADGQYDPAEIERVVEPVAAGRADFVSGSRRLGTELTSNAMRHAGVVVFGALLSMLAGQRVTDPACGLRAMRAEVTAVVTLHQPQYQASELLLGAALAGFRLAEVPTTMRDRGAGRTKKGGDLLYGVRFARVIVETWWRECGASSWREFAASWWRERSASRIRRRSEKIHSS